MTSLRFFSQDSNKTHLDWEKDSGRHGTHFDYDSIRLVPKKRDNKNSFHYWLDYEHEFAEGSIFEYEIIVPDNLMGKLIHEHSGFEIMVDTDYALNVIQMNPDKVFHFQILEHGFKEFCLDKIELKLLKEHSSKVILYTEKY